MVHRVRAKASEPVRGHRARAAAGSACPTVTAEVPAAVESVFRSVTAVDRAASWPAAPPVVSSPRDGPEVCPEAHRPVWVWPREHLPQQRVAVGEQQPVWPAPWAASAWTRRPSWRVREVPGAWFRARTVHVLARREPQLHRRRSTRRLAVRRAQGSPAPQGPTRPWSAVRALWLGQPGRREPPSSVRLGQLRPPPLRPSHGPCAREKPWPGQQPARPWRRQQPSGPPSRRVPPRVLLAQRA